MQQTSNCKPQVRRIAIRYDRAWHLQRGYLALTDYSRRQARGQVSKDCHALLRPRSGGRDPSSVIKKEQPGLYSRIGVFGASFEVLRPSLRVSD